MTYLRVQVDLLVHVDMSVQLELATNVDMMVHINLMVIQGTILNGPSDYGPLALIWTVKWNVRFKFNL
jgi:hypothetical protein